jgi:hypothetical protein
MNLSLVTSPPLGIILFPVPQIQPHPRRQTAYANHHDYEIMSFDVKTAFLHAKLDYLLYVKQIPGFPESDPHTVLRLLVALYGLRQSAYEFYNFFLKLLVRIGLSHSELDHSVFIGRWMLLEL